MRAIDDFIRRLLEDDDEENVKDLLSTDYAEPSPLEGHVERFDRWADIRIGENHFCISYLTPIAVYTHGRGIFVTDRNWSPTTKRHIVKWANEIGMGPYRRYEELEDRSSIMSQEEILKLFREQSGRVRWTKRQAKMASRVPDTMTGLRSDSDERIDVRATSQND